MNPYAVITEIDTAKMPDSNCWQTLGLILISMSLCGAVGFGVGKWLNGRYVEERLKDMSGLPSGPNQEFDILVIGSLLVGVWLGTVSARWLAARRERQTFDSWP